MASNAHQPSVVCSRRTSITLAPPFPLISARLVRPWRRGGGPPPPQDPGVPEARVPGHMSPAVGQQASRGYLLKATQIGIRVFVSSTGSTFPAFEGARLLPPALPPGFTLHTPAREYPTPRTVGFVDVGVSGRKCPILPFFVISGDGHVTTGFHPSAIFYGVSIDVSFSTDNSFSFIDCFFLLFYRS